MSSLYSFIASRYSSRGKGDEDEDAGKTANNSSPSSSSSSSSSSSYPSFSSFADPMSPIEKMGLGMMVATLALVLSSILEKFRYESPTVVPEGHAFSSNIFLGDDIKALSRYFYILIWGVFETGV